MPDAATSATEPSALSEPQSEPQSASQSEPPTKPATVNLAPPSTATSGASEASPAWHGVARSPRAPQTTPPPRRAGRRWLRWLRVVVLVILLPVVALGIGLLVAWIVHQIRGNPSVAPAPANPSPSASAVKKPPPSAPPRPVTVPADWVAESDPPTGLTFRHPPGWIRRTALPEIVRFAPVSAGSTTPGIDGVGAGFEATGDPSQAIAQFVSRAYGNEPQVQEGTITAVAGGHPGERQEIVTYVRSGVPVRVVVHGFASGTRTVIVLGRAASAQPARAAELEAAIEASVQLTG